MGNQPMKKCPGCSAELKENAVKCDACGLSIGDDLAETAFKPDKDQDQTPTQVQTESHKSIHTTTSGAGRFAIGAVLDGRYQILNLIGKGGMGEVYKADDLELKQTVALKFLPEELKGNEELLERFRGEVRNARRVSHENVCRVFDIGEADGLYYLSMEYIEGDDLSMLLSRIGRLPSDKAVEISREIAMGLNAIHKQGILHRDLKPANIIIDSGGTARITDFGIAGLEADVQGAESKVGTPAYMSPEQVSGKEVTKRSDIYSLGLLLYEIFTGTQAIQADTIPELLRKQKTATPTRASEIVAGIDPQVEELIFKCLEKDPGLRPDSAIHVAMALPGGNPLQVALEAGETPTPDMVAAAPQKGILKPLIALGMFAFVVAVFLFSAYLTSTYSVTARTPFERSPEALAERARTVIRKLGYPDQAVDSVYKIRPNPSYKRFASSQANPSDLWRRIEKGNPFYYYFFYRESQSLLDPVNGSNAVFEGDPPVTESGMINVKLDVTGRLIEFRAVPPVTIPEKHSAAQVEWPKLFVEAGLDFAKFKETSPTRTPFFHSDEIREWSGPLRDYPDILVSVRGAAFRGKPIEFRVVPKWDDPPPAIARGAGTSGPSWWAIFTGLLVWAIYIGALILARYNLKNGRSDLTGGLKLALITFLMQFIAGVLFADRLTPFSASTIPLTSLAPLSLELPIWLFVFYLALEPFARKFWPSILISWNRILKGDFRNPMIGRDILAGFFVCGIFRLVFIGTHILSQNRNPQYIFDAFDSVYGGALNGTAQHVGLFFLLAPWAVLNTYFFVLMVLLPYLIFKRMSIALIVAFLILLTQTVLSVWSGENQIYLFLDVFDSVLIVIVALRIGVVASVGYLVMKFSLSWIHLTLDTSRYYFSSTLIVSAVILIIATYAFYISIGNKPLFGKGLLEDS